MICYYVVHYINNSILIFKNHHGRLIDSLTVELLIVTMAKFMTKFNIHLF